MYALLDENDLLVDGKPVAIYRTPQPITYTLDGEEYQAPANWMQLWSLEEKAEKHIVPMSTNTYDKKWEYLGADAVYVVEFDEFRDRTVSETWPVLEKSVEQGQQIVTSDLTGFAEGKRDQGFVYDGDVFATTGHDVALSNLVYSGGQGNAPFSINFGMRTRDGKTKVLLNNAAKRKAYGESLIVHMDDTNEAYDEHLTWVNDPARTVAELKAHDITSTITTPWPVVPSDDQP